MKYDQSCHEKENMIVRRLLMKTDSKGVVVVELNYEPCLREKQSSKYQRGTSWTLRALIVVHISDAEHSFIISIEHDKVKRIEYDLHSALVIARPVQCDVDIVDVAEHGVRLVADSSIAAQLLQYSRFEIAVKVFDIEVVVHHVRHARV